MVYWKLFEQKKNRANHEGRRNGERERDQAVDSQNLIAHMQSVINSLLFYFLALLSILLLKIKWKKKCANYGPKFSMIAN